MNDVVKTRKKSKKRNYFTLETQEKIIEYQNCEVKKTKDRLYVKHIMPAFTELVNSLVAVYKFKASNEDINHLKNDCTTFLFETLHKWNPEKGTKAFSYYNVVAKNWLTINSRRLMKNAKRNVSIDCVESLSNSDKKTLSNVSIELSPEDAERKSNRPNVIIDMFKHVEKQLKRERDVKCIKAVIHLFENIDNLDYLNKRAVFVYLREISGLSSSELSSSLSTIRKHASKVVGIDNMFDIYS
jgi:hypothetical protein